MSHFTGRRAGVSIAAASSLTAHAPRCYNWAVMMKEKLPLFPVTAAINKAGHLEIGGADTVRLAADFGTPLYLYDELTLRRACREYREAFGEHYPGASVIYAAKAFICGALAHLLDEEGLGLDVISGGELAAAARAAFPGGRIYLHGNNKSAAEITAALRYGVGRIVVDNFHELEMLDGIAGGMNMRPDILLRLAPGVDPHTHRHITTGNLDSKFGFPMAQAAEALARAGALPALNVVGLHCHLGSQLHGSEPYLEAIEIMMGFAAEMSAARGFNLEELDIGGGFAIPYTMGEQAPGAAVFAAAIAAEIKAQCRRLRLETPRLVIEPGRAIVGRAGVALYTAGAAKDIPGVRRYVSLDGGMTDNIRPALYGATYEAVAAGRMNDKSAEKVSLAGKYCESADILIRDIDLPPLVPGDILAVADAGAYCLAMGSNYNGALKPAVVMVAGGKARLIRRRETADDLLAGDTFVKEAA